jgi:hypothetical protein
MKGAAVDWLAEGAGLISRTSVNPYDEAQHFMLRPFR